MLRMDLKIVFIFVSGSSQNTNVSKVSLESRHRKQKGGKVGGMGFNASGFVDNNMDERLIP